jgi:arginase
MNLNQQKIALIGIPLDEYSSFLRGAAFAPPLIRKALHSESSNMWTEMGVNLGDKTILTDTGDISFSTANDPFGEIEKNISQLLEQKMRPIVLGGDHSITFPIIKAFSKYFPKIDVLHFDAHPDLYHKFAGNKSSHACPFARIMENGLVQRLVQVGIRTCNGHQREQAEKFGVEMIEMKHFKNNIKLNFENPLYISFDLDALDPAFAPGVSHWEPGGLSTRQVISTIQSVEAPDFVGADIVEFNPSRDSAGFTAMTCAKILKEIVGRML